MADQPADHQDPGRTVRQIMNERAQHVAVEDRNCAVGCGPWPCTRYWDLITEIETFPASA